MQVQNRQNIKYNGTVQGLKYIWKTEGFRGLFKGNGTNCARIVPNSAVKFFSYEQASTYVSPHLFSEFNFISLLYICYVNSISTSLLIVSCRGILWLYKQQPGNGTTKTPLQNTI